MARTAYARISVVEITGSYGLRLDQARIGVATTRTPSASPSHQLPATDHHSEDSPSTTAVVAPSAAPTIGPSAAAHTRKPMSPRAGCGATDTIDHRTRVAPTRGSSVLASAKPSALPIDWPWVRSTTISVTPMTSSQRGHVRRRRQEEHAHRQPGGREEGSAGFGVSQEPEGQERAEGVETG